MSNVYLPVHVAALFRRLVDAISALSTSTQYLRLVKTGVEQQRSSESTSAVSDSSTTVTESPNPSSGTLQAFKTVEWPWWTFPESWKWGQFTVHMLRSSPSPSMSSTTPARLAPTLNCVSFPGCMRRFDTQNASSYTWYNLTVVRTHLVLALVRLYPCQWCLF